MDNVVLQRGGWVLLNKFEYVLIIKRLIVLFSLLNNFCQIFVM